MTPSGKTNAAEMESSKQSFKPCREARENLLFVKSAAVDGRFWTLRSQNADLDCPAPKQRSRTNPQADHERTGKSKK